MNGVKYLATFVIGAAAGSVATWFVVKKKYEGIANEEIESVKEAFSKRYVKKEEPEGEVVEQEEKAEPKMNKPDVFEYTSLLDEENYTNYTKPEDIQEEHENGTAPVVIPPDEFGEIEDYDRISLYYFSDGYLTDDSYELVENVDETVGMDSLKHFGEWEDDSVYVRNNRLRCDYEILLDLRKYTDVIRNVTHQREVE